jgi:hypothetical protein
MPTIVSLRTSRGPDAQPQHDFHGICGDARCRRIVGLSLSMTSEMSPPDLNKLALFILILAVVGDQPRDVILGAVRCGNCTCWRRRRRHDGSWAHAFGEERMRESRCAT